MIALETSRLVLRNFRPEDAGPLLEYAVQYSASPQGIYDYAWETTPEKIQQTVDRFSQSDSFIAVCLKESGQYVGFVDLVKGAEDGDCAEFDLGYGFAFQFHGQGFATEACEMLVEYAFTQLSAQHITAGTAQANLASQRVLEKLGFVKCSEEQVSFQDDGDGKPIIFTGYGYQLTRQRWEDLHR